VEQWTDPSQPPNRPDGPYTPPQPMYPPPPPSGYAPPQAPGYPQPTGPYPYASPPSVPFYVPMPYAVPPQPSNGLAVSSMVLGILSLVGTFTVIASACVVPFSGLGLILGIIALNRPYGRNMAVAGLWMNGISAVLSIGISLIWGIPLMVAFLGLIFAIPAASP
jgi:hypothetical protein